MELSEEDKAIEYIKNIKSWWWNNSPDRVYIINKNDIEQFDMLINLIEKQQKEIEEWRNGIRINDKVSVPKDKIRAKIQLYKDKKADSIGMLINYEYWKAKIEILQELLEENTNE